MNLEKGELLTGEALHRRVVVRGILEAEQFVWIATADLKDLHIAMARGYRSILEEFDRMAGRGVSFRIAHSKRPSTPFRASLAACPRLLAGHLELQRCPRTHWKLVVVDARLAYLGSANFTGAGLGVRRRERRNLEVGVLLQEPSLVRGVMDLFDQFWIGAHCEGCALRRRCPSPIR